MYKLTFLFCLTFGVYLAQPSKILLTNAILHIGNGEILNPAFIGVENDRISLVKSFMQINEADWDTIIDLQNAHVYPGFIATNTTLGLTEIDEARPTRDFLEIGDYNPHIRSLSVFNTDSKIIETVRSNGVLLTQATPRGGIVSGTSSIFHLNGWNWEDAVVQKDDGVHLNWPIESSSNYEEQKQAIFQFFQAGKKYSPDMKKGEFDQRYHALLGLFQSEKRLYVHANHVKQLLDIIEFSKNLEIKYPVIVGGYESYLITERLKDAKIPVMLMRLHSLPLNDDDPVDLPYRLPSILLQAGIKYCLQNEGDMEAMNARNLPFLAGNSVAYGVPQEDAIKSIAINVAEITGIEKDYGTVVVGKKATIFASKGNALDMRTNDISLILIDGKLVDYSNFQTKLFAKYKKKYNLK